MDDVSLAVLSTMADEKKYVVTKLASKIFPVCSVYKVESTSFREKHEIGAKADLNREVYLALAGSPDYM